MIVLLHRDEVAWMNAEVVLGLCAGGLGRTRYGGLGNVCMGGEKEGEKEGMDGWRWMGWWMSSE